MKLTLESAETIVGLIVAVIAVLSAIAAVLWRIIYRRRLVVEYRIPEKHSKTQPGVPGLEIVIRNRSKESIRLASVSVVSRTSGAVEIYQHGLPEKIEGRDSYSAQVVDPAELKGGVSCIACKDSDGKEFTLGRWALRKLNRRLERGCS